MKEINTDELKKVQLEILDKVDEFCKKNKITYYLAGGTLIGAVRHKGYIPWDDDIDILIKREEYDFFIKNFDLSNDLKVVSIENCTDYYLPFAKVINNKTILKEEVNSKVNLGVNIDIFPLDEINKDNFNNFYRNQKTLINLLTLKNISIKKRGILKDLIIIGAKIFLLPFPKKILIKKINQNAQKYNGKNCNCLGELVLLMYGNGNCWNKEYFDETILLPFENRKYSCPKEYDKILTNTYGDYMKLPPIEKQVTHHSFVAYWKE